MAKMKAVAQQLNDDVIALDALRRKKDELEDTIDALQQRIVLTLDSLEVKTHSVEGEGGRTIKATRSQSNRTVIDETGLKKSLGETLWNKVSSRVLDKKKLEAYIASGEVNPTTVAKCSTENEGKPYIRITA
jgi:hypothetical protein